MNIERIFATPLDENTARQYIEKIAVENCGRAAENIKYLGGGSFGQAYGLDFSDCKKIVIKFLRAKDMLEKEVCGLKLLSANSTVKIPSVLFVRKADDLIPIDCYGMEHIDGECAYTAFLSLQLNKQERLDFADKVTTALHAIHCCRNDKFGDAHSPQHSTWIEYYEPFARAVYEKAEELFDAKELSEKIIFAMRAAWEKFDMIFSEPVKEACLIHGDLNIANIMVNKGHKISGFIDPLNCLYADREYDLFQFDNLGGERFYLRETYIRKYGASKYCNLKCAFYGLWNEVYCYIKAGVLIDSIMNPLIEKMYKRLAEL